jgi:membrane fusion protein
MTGSAWQPRIVNQPPRPATRTPLFRPEVLAERQTQWLGTVLLTPRISHTLFAIIATVAILATAALLFFGDYTRKERISGWLVPDLGLVRIFAPQPAVIARLDVEDGDKVLRGAPLMVLSTEQQSAAMGGTQEQIVRQLTSRRDSMITEQKLRAQLSQQKIEGITRRLDALRAERDLLDAELDLQRERFELADSGVERLRGLHEANLIPAPRWQEAADARLDHAVRLRALELQRAAAERERLLLEDQLTSLPLETRTVLAEIDRQVATLEQELAQAEVRREIVIPAPEDGTVTGVQAQQGDSANTSVPLLSIVPEGSLLEAQLFVPSSAIGFIRPGQSVLLRYNAFPYQKFGHYEGVVIKVAHSALTQNELARRSSGSSADQQRGEPVYPVVVRLKSQTATAYGEPIALQPGMQLEADILIERRRLIEWVLEPLFTVTGGWTA